MGGVAEASGLSAAAISKRYHRLCLLLHPDKLKSTGTGSNLTKDAAVAFDRVKWAGDELRDGERRGRLDAAIDDAALWEEAVAEARRRERVRARDAPIHRRPGGWEATPSQAGMGFGGDGGKGGGVGGEGRAAWMTQIAPDGPNGQASRPGQLSQKSVTRFTR